MVSQTIDRILLMFEDTYRESGALAPTTVFTWTSIDIEGRVFMSKSTSASNLSMIDYDLDHAYPYAINRVTYFILVGSGYHPYSLVEPSAKWQPTSSQGAIIRCAMVYR